MEYIAYRCKSMLKRKDHVDSWFWTENGCSPYRGCEHQCVYCDGRNSYYGVKDFSNRVYVKVNSEEILKKELEKRFPKQKNLFEFGYETRKPTLYIGSGTSDAFQQAEAKYRLTQRLLKIFLKYGVPLHIMTKSALVLRDLELLKELSDKSWLTISFSFSTSDVKLSKKFEPKTSPPEARFKSIEKLTRKKIRCGVTYIPILPLLSDSRENLEAVISKAKNSGASYILIGTMTLKEEDREL
ncbi:MAG: radical SAM protein, partial [Candidatus Methanofastidiosia archaeon]